MSQSADVVICGAGIAGIAAAYHLTVKHGLERVVLVDDQAPLTVTSDKSTECYRNWWPGLDGAMVSLMNRSIDLLEEAARASDNIFNLNRRGYLYVTGDPDRIAAFRRSGEMAAAQGAGPMRDKDYIPPSPTGSFEDEPTGADLILDPATIRGHFPCLTERVVAAVHVRRCGWFSAQQLGMYLLDCARDHGARLVSARVESVETDGGRVRGVRLSDGGRIATGTLVNAAGPHLLRVGRMLGVDLPVFSELHGKVAFTDHRGIVPRDAPLLIWCDPQTLDWSSDERAVLLESDETRWMLDQLPAGAHLRPEGEGASNTVLMLWAYDAEPVPEVFPPRFDPSLPDVVLHGLATMIPDLRAYYGHAPKPFVDGGYYTKTRENRPLIGPLPVEGAYLIGALSGFGLMAASGAGELLAAHVTGGELPTHARAFTLARYDDPDYRSRLESWSEQGQL